MTDRESTLIHRWFEEVWNKGRDEDNPDTRSKDASEDATSDRLDYGL